MFTYRIVDIMKRLSGATTDSSADEDYNPPGTISAAKLIVPDNLESMLTPLPKLGKASRTLIMKRSR